MITAKPQISSSQMLSAKLKAYYELTKFRLSFLVAFSGSFGYLLAIKKDNFSWIYLLIFAIAGFTITAAANIVNQIKEIELDKLMKRTMNRPLPTGRLTVNEAMVFCAILFALAITLFLAFFNIRATSIALLSFLLYGFVYTPLKRVGPIAVFVGAFPGAFPPMIGWVAATNHFSLEPGILFAIQFFGSFRTFGLLLG